MVRFDANGGVGGLCEHHDFGMYIEAPLVTREGYSFVGWTPEVAATVPASNVTYTAQWKINEYAVSLFVDDGEEHIPRRLEREKRCGRVERLDEHHWRFTADVYDALEMLPWLRTFIGRITELKCDDPRVTERYCGDLAAMAALYGGDGDAVS